MKKVEFPTALKAGAFQYKIEVWESREAGASNCWGETNDRLKIVRVDLNYGMLQAATTLLHEILHVAYVRWGVEDGDKEERTISGLEEGLSAMWRDNPDVFAWIHQEMTRG